MSEIINIDFDKQLLEDDAHLHNLKIASLNLAEFNKRNPEEELVKFEYVKVNDKYTFRKIPTSVYPHYSEQYLPLDWFIIMSRNPQWHAEWIEYYPERMYNHFFDYYNLYGSSKIDLFVKLFKDFCPLGDFLSEEHTTEIKKVFNNHCQIAESYR